METHFVPCASGTVPACSYIGFASPPLCRVQSVQHGDPLPGHLRPHSDGGRLLRVLLEPLEVEFYIYAAFTHQRVLCRVAENVEK